MHQYRIKRAPPRKVGGVHVTRGRRTRQSGFSMIEVMISLLILLFGLLGLAGLIVTSQKAEAESYQRAQALLLLQDMVARVNTNRAVAPCYAITTNLANGLPFAGVGSAAPPNCGLGNVQAYTLANTDLSAWDSLLKGSAESFSGANAGGVVGARGCISVDAVSGIYQVSVAWQGRMPTAAPIASMSCGAGQYGDERLRRVVSLPLQIANLN